MKEIIISNIRNLFEHEEKGFNKPLIINNFQSNNHISKGKKVKKIKKYKRKRDRRTLSFGENLNTISSYLKDIRNDLKKFGKWKIQLSITTNFTSSKDDNDEDCEMHSKSGNIKVMMNDKGDEIIEECFKSPVERHQNKFKESTKSIPFVFDYVRLLYYKCHKINPNCDESYIDFPDWIKSKKNSNKSYQ